MCLYRNKYKVEEKYPQIVRNHQHSGLCFLTLNVMETQMTRIDYTIKNTAKINKVKSHPFKIKCDVGGLT